MQLKKKTFTPSFFNPIGELILKSISEPSVGIAIFSKQFKVYNMSGCWEWINEELVVSVLVMKVINLDLI